MSVQISSQNSSVTSTTQETTSAPTRLFAYLQNIEKADTSQDLTLMISERVNALGYCTEHQFYETGFNICCELAKLTYFRSEDRIDFGLYVNKAETLANFCNIEVRNELGYKFLNIGALDQARKLFIACSTSTDNDPRLDYRYVSSHIGLASVDLRQRDYQSAYNNIQAVFSRLAKCTEDKKRQLFTQIFNIADELAEAGFYHYASTLYTECLKNLNPVHDSATILTRYEQLNKLQIRVSDLDSAQKTLANLGSTVSSHESILIQTKNKLKIKFLVAYCHALSGNNKALDSMYEKMKKIRQLNAHTEEQHGQPVFEFNERVGFFLQYTNCLILHGHVDDARTYIYDIERRMYEILPERYSLLIRTIDTPASKSDFDKAIQAETEEFKSFMKWVINIFADLNSLKASLINTTDSARSTRELEQTVVDLHRLFPTIPPIQTQISEVKQNSNLSLSERCRALDNLSMSYTSLHTTQKIIFLAEYADSLLKQGGEQNIPLAIQCLRNGMELIGQDSFFANSIANHSMFNLYARLLYRAGDRDSALEVLEILLTKDKARNLTHPAIMEAYYLASKLYDEIELTEHGDQAFKHAEKLRVELQNSNTSKKYFMHARLFNSLLMP